MTIFKRKSKVFLSLTFISGEKHQYLVWPSSASNKATQRRCIEYQTRIRIRLDSFPHIFSMGFIPQNKDILILWFILCRRIISLFFWAADGSPKHYPTTLPFLRNAGSREPFVWPLINTNVAVMATELTNFLVREGGSNACKWWPTLGPSAGASPADVLWRLK